jgi:hypothetical protein
MSRRLSGINSHATPVLVCRPGHGSWENSHANSRLSTLMQLLFSFDRGVRVEKTLMQTLASQLSSTLMQLLFSFDRGMRVEKTLIQTIASQLSSTLMQLLFSFDLDMRVEKTLMQTFASQLSCNSRSRLTGAWELRKLSCKLSLLNSRATLVLVWPGHESWENSHTNSRLSSFSLVSLGFSLRYVTKKRLCFRLQETELSKPGHLLKKFPFQRSTGVGTPQV